MSEHDLYAKAMDLMEKKDSSKNLEESVPTDNDIADQLQNKAIELTNQFPELIHYRREELCAAFSEAIEWGRNN
jgi:hypothetical protein